LCLSAVFGCSPELVAAIPFVCSACELYPAVLACSLLHVFFILTRYTRINPVYPDIPGLIRIFYDYCGFRYLLAFVSFDPYADPI
jgi:hypothetical protein